MASDVKVDLNGPTLQISAIGIHSVSFFSGTNNVAFDDFVFGPVRAVPEPAIGIGVALGAWMIGSRAARVGRCRSRSS